MNDYDQIVLCCDDISFLRKNVHNLKYTVEIILQVRQKLYSTINIAVD